MTADIAGNTFCFQTICRKMGSVEHTLRISPNFKSTWHPFLLMPLVPKYQPPWKLVSAVAPQRLVSMFHLSPSPFSKLHICFNHFSAASL